MSNANVVEEVSYSFLAFPFQLRALATYVTALEKKSAPINTLGFHPCLRHYLDIDTTSALIRGEIMERGSLWCVGVIFVALQLLATPSAFAEGEIPQAEKILLPQMKDCHFRQEVYPLSARKNHEEALTLIAFKIDKSGRVIEPRIVAASNETEFHKAAIRFLKFAACFSMPEEPELSRVTKHEFKAVVAFNIECEEKKSRRQNRPGQWQESDRDWADAGWFDITTDVQCERIRGT